MDSFGKDHPRERIFDSAVRLFARKGYHGVGVREIAGDAGVNISMISYYFGGKVGLLREIIDRFFESYFESVRDFFDSDREPSFIIKEYINRLVKLILDNPDLCSVGFFELPYDTPEIAQFKSEKVAFIKDMAQDKIFRRIFGSELDIKTMAILGPAFISMVFSHFLLKDLVRYLFPDKFDEAFYRQYCDLLSAFFLRGIEGVAKIRLDVVS